MSLCKRENLGLSHTGGGGGGVEGFLVCKDYLIIIIYTNVTANWRGGLRLVLSGINQA